MTEEAKFCVKSCRDWYQAFANHGKGEERSVKELLTTADLIESLSAQLEQVTRERDAAVNDIEDCLHAKGECEPECKMCNMQKPACNWECEKAKWKWRGVREVSE